jgi:hypothetical protein
MSFTIKKNGERIGVAANKVAAVEAARQDFAEEANKAERHSQSFGFNDFTGVGSVLIRQSDDLSILHCHISFGTAPTIDITYTIREGR